MDDTISTASGQDLPSEEVKLLLDSLQGLLAEIHEVKLILKDILAKKTAEDNHLPRSLANATVEDSFRKATFKPPQRRPILEGEIRDALSRFKSIMDAARYLNVSFSTLKRYMTMYNLMEELWKPSRGNKVGGVGKVGVYKEQTYNNNNNISSSTVPSFSASFSSVSSSSSSSWSSFTHNP